MSRKRGALQDQMSGVLYRGIGYFGFGDGVRIETPSAMQEEHRAKAAAVVALYRPC